MHVGVAQHKQTGRTINSRNGHGGSRKEAKKKKMLNKYKNWLCRGLPVKLKVKQEEGRRGTGREGREVRNKTENKRNVNERESDGRVRRGWGGGVLPAGCAGNQSWKLGNKIKRTATKQGTRGRGRGRVSFFQTKQGRKWDEDGRRGRGRCWCWAGEHIVLTFCKWNIPKIAAKC